MATTHTPNNFDPQQINRAHSMWGTFMRYAKISSAVCAVLLALLVWVLKS